MKVKRKVFYKPDAVYVGNVDDELPNKGQVRIHAVLEDKNPFNRFGVDLVIPHSFLKFGDKVEVTVKKIKSK